jgi:hypothetical protein
LVAVLVSYAASFVVDTTYGSGGMTVVVMVHRIDLPKAHTLLRENILFEFLLLLYTLLSGTIMMVTQISSNEYKACCQTPVCFTQEESYNWMEIESRQTKNS